MFAQLRFSASPRGPNGPSVKVLTGEGEKDTPPPASRPAFVNFVKYVCVSSDIIVSIFF